MTRSPESIAKQKLAIQARVAAGLGFGFKKGYDSRRNLDVARANLKPYIPGPSHPRWRGGVSEAYNKQHLDREITMWSRAVRERDNYTCRTCGATKPKRMSAHHLKSILDFPDEATDVNNGITLCEPCHQKLHWAEIRERSYE